MAEDENKIPKSAEEKTDFNVRYRHLAAKPSRASGRRTLWRRAGGIFLRVMALLLATALLFAVFLLSVLGVVFRGPSEAVRDIVASSLMGTSALKFIPRWYLSEEQIDVICHPEPDTFNALRSETALTVSSAPEESESAQEEAEVIELVDIHGPTWRGKMLIIHDPSLVLVGTLDSFGDKGLFLYEFVEKYQALAGTNAGGFYDPDGEGTGGIPDGLVINGGAIVYGYTTALYSNIVGFDAEHRLHVGNMTGQEALDLGLQSAVSFAPGPILIVDGERQSGWNRSLNPRTCIGQAEDGTVFLAVIEGRHPGSLGAYFDDLADLMEDCGAVNASNLDGGSSSTMFYNGEQITRGSNVVGARQLATAILVLPAESE